MQAEGLSITTIVATVSSISYTLYTAKIISPIPSKKIFALSALICLQGLSIGLSVIIFLYKDIKSLPVTIISKFAFRFALPVLEYQTFKDWCDSNKDCRALDMQNPLISQKYLPIIFASYSFLQLPNYFYFFIYLMGMEPSRGYNAVSDITFLFSGTLLGLLKIVVSFDTVRIVSNLLARRHISNRNNSEKLGSVYYRILRNLYFTLGLDIMINCLTVSSVMFIILYSSDVYLELVLPFAVTEYCMVSAGGHQFQKLKHLAGKLFKSQNSIQMSVNVIKDNTDIVGKSRFKNNAEIENIQQKNNQDLDEGFEKISDDKIAVAPGKDDISTREETNVIPESSTVPSSSMSYSGTKSFSYNGTIPGRTIALSSVKPDQPIIEHAEEDFETDLQYGSFTAAPLSYKPNGMEKSLNMAPLSQSSKIAPSKVAHVFLGLKSKSYQEKKLTKTAEYAAPLSTGMQKSQSILNVLGSMNLFNSKAKSNADLADTREEEVFMNDNMDPNDPNFRVPGQSYFTSQLSEHKDVSGESFISSYQSRAMSTSDSRNQTSKTTSSEELPQNNESRQKIGLSYKRGTESASLASGKFIQSPSQRYPLSSNAVIPETIVDASTSYSEYELGK